MFDRAPVSKLAVHWSQVVVVAALQIAALTSARSQQPIPAPILKPFADNHDWVLIEDVIYRVGDSQITIVVPKGFVTDFASIPPAFWSFGLSPNGKYSKAAIVHDFLYWSHACTRKQSDNILDIAMQESNVPSSTRQLIYEGVRHGGATAWKQNATERVAGLPRVIPVAELDFGPMVIWSDYRVALQKSGIRDSAVALPPETCAVGNSTNVPKK